MPGVHMTTDELFYYPLLVPQQTAYRELGVEPDASPREVSAAKSAATRRMQQEIDALSRAGDDSDGAAAPRARALREQIEELNLLALEMSDKRAAYDRAHPPLGLLKLEDCTLDGFVTGAACLQLVRSDVARYLSAQGEPVFHPSDFTRDEFVSDFTANPLLDEQWHG